MTEIALRAVTFHSDGATFEYAIPGIDVRDNGLVQNRVLYVPANDLFQDRLVDLLETSTKAVRDFLKDYETALPEEPEPEEDDDGPSPYDNPNDFT